MPPGQNAGNGYPQFAVEILDRIDTIRGDFGRSLSRTDQRVTVVETQISEMAKDAEKLPCDLHDQKLQAFQRAIDKMPTKEDFEKTRKVGQVAVVIAAVGLLLLNWLGPKLFAAIAAGVKP